jgi:hypothetical protein
VLVFELPVLEMQVLEMQVPVQSLLWLQVLGHCLPQLVCYFRFDYQP